MTALTCAERSRDPGQGDTSDRSVFDPAGLVDRCMGEASAAFGLLGMFRDRLPGTIAEIRDRVLKLNGAPGALATLHTLKGNAGNLCAGRLYDAASRLETILRNEQFADTAVRLADLQQEAERFLQALPSDLETLI